MRQADEKAKIKPNSFLDSSPLLSCSHDAARIWSKKENEFKKHSYEDLKSKTDEMDFSHHGEHSFDFCLYCLHYFFLLMCVCVSVYIYCTHTLTMLP